MLHNYLAGQSTYHNLKKKWTDFRIPVRCPDQTCSIDILIQKSLLTFLKSSIWSFEHFQFSTNFLSDMILQCMTIYLYWEKPVWLWYQYWIRPNIAANTKNSVISQSHEKSSYRTNCKCFTYVTKTNGNLTKYSRKPGDYNCIIIFDIDIMKNSSPLNLKFTVFANVKTKITLLFFWTHSTLSSAS